MIDAETIVAIIALALLVAREFLIRATFFFWWKKKPELPNVPGVLCERVEYGSDGLNITAVLCRPARKGRFPIIVKCHGYHMPTEYAKHVFVEERKARETSWWASKGFAVIAPNYRGTSGSDGNVEGGEGEFEDCRNAIRYLSKKKYADASKVFFIGKSMGGAIALRAAAEIPQVKAAAVYYSPYDFTSNRRKLHIIHLCFVWATMGVRALFGGLEKISPKNFAQNIRCPVVLFYGKSDEVVSWRDAEKIARLCRGGKTKIVTYEGEGHGFSRSAGKKSAQTALGLFLEQLKKK